MAPWLRALGRGRAPALPPHVRVGRHTYGVAPRNCVRPTAQAPITVGAFCSVGPDVLLFGQADHALDRASTFPFKARLFTPDLPDADATTRGPLVIGHDVWIGARAMILSGVTIGHGAVIGAGAVVARDVAPYAIMVGNPARLVRHRFPPAIVAALLEIAWWDWPDARIKAMQPEFDGPIEAFLEAARA